MTGTAGAGGRLSINVCSEESTLPGRRSCWVNLTLKAALLQREPPHSCMGGADIREQYQHQPPPASCLARKLW